jgi:hypothetical protein
LSGSAILFISLYALDYIFSDQADYFAKFRLDVPEGFRARGQHMAEIIYFRRVGKAASETTSFPIDSQPTQTEQPFVFIKSFA